LKFIVGIGNPGRKYEGTRHNVGFRALDRLRARDLKDAVLVKPDTFVNNTGEAVAEILRKQGAVPRDLLIVCDDVNLAFGKLRLRDSGGPGGHHGLESVIAAAGTEDFPRLRIGVGSEGMPKDDLTDYVLGRFSTEEEKALEGILEKAASVCESWVKEGFGGATNVLSRLQSVNKEKE
jgi:peptidyl-tRNA hydrolase, PTH1 family